MHPHEDNPRKVPCSPAPIDVAKIPDRAQVIVGHLPVAVDLRLLDLQFGEGLVCLVALGGELVAALVSGKLHGGIGAALRSRVLDGPVYLPDAAIEVRYYVGLAGQLYASGSDTINGTAGSTGVALTANQVTLVFCIQSGKWLTK